MPLFISLPRAPCLAGIFALTAIVAQPCYATHWQVIGRPDSSRPGLAYVDMDSIHQDGQYRIATFLTVYSNPATNAYDIKMDRIAQDTAFDCAKHTFSLVSTIAYLQGRRAGGSSDSGDWKVRFKGLPPNGYSQRAFDVTCNAPVAVTPEPEASPAEAAATVKLPTIETPD
jgi:hypothetical protein